MNARDAEADLLARCVHIARDARGTVSDERTANVVRVAAMLARPRHPAAARLLRDAADACFARHPEARRSADELIRLGWLVSLPRFRDLLEVRLATT